MSVTTCDAMKQALNQAFMAGVTNIGTNNIDATLTAADSMPAPELQPVGAITHSPDTGLILLRYSAQGNRETLDADASANTALYFGDALVNRGTSEATVIINGQEQTIAPRGKLDTVDLCTNKTKGWAIEIEAHDIAEPRGDTMNVRVRDDTQLAVTG